MFFRLPTGFLPTEDQGAAQRPVPPARRARRRTARWRCSDAIENYFCTSTRAKNVRRYFTVAGGGGGGGAPARIPARASSTSRLGTSGTGKENTADAIVERASGAFRGLRDAQVFALVPGAIRGLGQSSGFTMQLQNTQRHEPRAVRGGARPAARSRRNADPTLTSGAPQRSARRRDPQGRRRTSSGWPRSASTRPTSTTRSRPPGAGATSTTSSTAAG